MAKTGVPGEPLADRHQYRLREAGFEVGYPVYLYGRGHLEVDDLNHILHMATMPELMDGAPVMLIGFWVSTKSGDDEQRTLPMQVRDICRCWKDGPCGAHWYLKGRWDPAAKGQRFVNRKSVAEWVIHLRLDGTDGAFVQFVPKDLFGKQILAPDGDDFRWGTRWAKALPPPCRKK